MPPGHQRQHLLGSGLPASACAYKATCTHRPVQSRLTCGQPVPGETKNTKFMAPYQWLPKFLYLKTSLEHPGATLKFLMQLFCPCPSYKWTYTQTDRQSHKDINYIRCLYLEYYAVFCRRLVLLSPVNTEVNINLTQRLNTRHVALIADTLLTTTTATGAPWRCGGTTQPCGAQYAVEFLPCLLVLSLDLQRTLYVVDRVNQQTLYSYTRMGGTARVSK